MKVIFEKTVMGQTAVRNATTPAIGDQGAFVRALVGENNPYWAWPSIPSGKVIAADFTDAPICSSSVAENNQAIASITADPRDVLTYDPPLPPAEG